MELHVCYSGFAELLNSVVFIRKHVRFMGIILSSYDLMEII
jgi:hypothetical protein